MPLVAPYMAKKYSEEIKKLELQARLMAQSNSRFQISAEVLKLKDRISEAEDTLAGLEIAIAETEKQLAS